MASCDVHVTPPVENGKDEPENDENGTNANGIRNTMNGTVPTTSKIPVLVRLDSNDSFTYTSTRKYSTLRNAIRTRTKFDKTFSSTSTLIYTGDDSGVQMDSSMLEDNYFRPGVLMSKTNSSTPRSHRSTETLMPPSESEQELGTAEQLTLRVLQRAVAEMEADVALHADMLEDEMNFELEQQLNSELELQSLRDINETLVQEEEETEQAEEPLQEEPQQQIPEEVDEDVSEEQTEELLRELSDELALELSEDLALELSEELPEKLSQELSEELAEELIKELPELPLELSEEAMINISEELPNIVSSELHKQHQLEDLHLELLERLAMKIEISEMPEIALPKLEEELPIKPLEQLPQEPSEQQVMELSAELAEKLSRELLEELPVQSVNLEQLTQSFSTRISMPRKHVRVEQLLEAENDIQMLNKLLSNDEADLLFQPNEPVPVDQNGNNDVEDLPLIPHNTSDDWNKNDLNFLESLMTFFCGKGIRKLGYPILLCGMAVGLIYYFRKG